MAEMAALLCCEKPVGAFLLWIGAEGGHCCDSHRALSVAEAMQPVPGFGDAALRSGSLCPRVIRLMGGTSKLAFDRWIPLF